MGIALLIVAAFNIITTLSNTARVVNSIGKPPPVRTKPTNWGRPIVVALVLQAATTTVIVIAALHLMGN